MFSPKIWKYYKSKEVRGAGFNDRGKKHNLPKSKRGSVMEFRRGDWNMLLPISKEDE